MRIRNRRKAAGVATLAVVAIALAAGTVCLSTRKAPLEISPVTATPIEAPVAAYEESEIRPRSTVYDALVGSGLSPQDVRAMVMAARDHQDLSRIRPGTRFRIERSDATLPPGKVRFVFSPVESLELTRADGGWSARVIREEVTTRLMNYAGSVTSSLWESALEATMDPNLIVELTEIFGWQVDFSREVRSGDSWRLTVEQKLVKGEPIGWGRIIAAEYRNDGTTHTAVLFEKDGQGPGYYNPDGSSLRRMFLKSPIKFGRISSRFSRKRFHPILLRNRPHLGVDYAAPRGTPIRAVGDGTVVIAGYRGGGGKTLRIRHNSIYQTAYLHLNGFAPGVRSGSRVKQGQIIGYVGSTGLSTGPHLHFEFFEHGRFVDPMGKRFPSADPVPASSMAEFRQVASDALATLPAESSWVKGILAATR